MEQQQNQYPHANESAPAPRKNGLKAGILTVIFVLSGVSIFTSGWLFGSGRLSFRSDSLVPVPSVGSAPTDGLDELYRQLTANYDGDISDEDANNSLKEGLAKAANDPFTEYLSEQKTKEFNESLDGTFEGIGAELGKEGNFVIIVAPLKGTPADRAGIQPRDIIEKIDGEDAFDISISEAVTRIRGPKGETVTLTIIRDGERIEVPIVRDTITIDSVEWELDGDIGIISISRFGNDTVRLSQQAATDVKARGAQKIILDLRGNPGGLLDASVSVANIWLPKGATVLEEKQNGKIVQTFKTENQPILADFPTVVLINEGSASASEIVAGALRDNNAATIIGQTSFGKGSVQRLIPLNAGGSLKVTIARWFTPSGTSIDKEGVKPDKEVELTREDVEVERDPQLDAAKDSLSE